MPTVDELMKKSQLADPEFYRGTAGVEGPAEKKERLKRERREKKNTLTQWYGMKRVVVTPEIAQELEMLKYRSFLHRDTAYQAPKRTDATDNSSQFVEFGYVAGTGKNKQRRLKSFADEWLGESEELRNVVAKRMKHNTKLNKKAKEARKKMAEKQKRKNGPKQTNRKRLQKHDSALM